MNCLSFISKKVIFSLLFTLFFFTPVQIFAASCSPYMGKATFNEFFKDRTTMANDADDFVEVKILDGAINSDIFDSWTIRVCEQNGAGSNDTDDCSSTISLSNFTETTLPWLILKNGNIGRYVNFKTGFDAILRDANGDVIDYFSLDGYTPLEDAGCPGLSLPYDFQFSAPGASDKFIYRVPDGSGDWGSAPSASASPTEDNTNDTDPDGNIPPVVSIANMVVNKGVTVTFTFALQGAAKTYDITIDYETMGGTAVTGTDYTYTTGTATITAGSTLTTVDVPTNAGSPSGLVYFYLFLSNPVNATLNNHYPVGTILGNPSAQWNMDEITWNGTSNEVVDSSGNNYHGTAINGTVTGGSVMADWAIASDPGTCRYGSFDGNNDYVALNGFLNLSGSFTITAWIRADAINNDQRIFADDESNSNGFAFSLGDGGDGRLRFFSRGVNPISLDSSAAITANQWHFVTAVHDVAAKTRQIFVDGNAVTTLSTYTGTWGTDNGTAAIGGETNGAGSEANANWRFDGDIDEVRVYSTALTQANIAAVMAETHACSSMTLHHIEIQHDGTALTCEPESVTLRVCANADCSTLYTDDVSVTMSPNGWVGGDTQIISGGSGSMQLRAAAGPVTLSVSSSTPAASNAVVCLNTSDSSSSCVLNFYDTGFIYSIPTQTSCQTSAAITVSAVRKDVTTQLCVPSFASRNETIKFWTGYSNPAAGTKKLTLNNGTADYILETTPPGTDVPLSFNPSGQATVTLNYPDAGQLTLNTRFDGAVGGPEAGLVMTGATTYVTKPAKLYVYSPDINADCASGNAGCSAFTPAGSSFNLTVRGACDDVASTLTPNFIHNGITLTHQLIAPAGGNPGNLGVASVNIADTDNGEATITTQSISEVGVFTIEASLGGTNYLGETVIGTTLLNTSANIGRFYPAYFDVSHLHGCNADSFTYSGQPFTVNVSALNTATVQTLNYTGSFVKDPSISNSGTATLFSNNVLDTAYFTNGYGTRTDITYTFAVKDTDPETITLRAVDDDSVTSSGHAEPTTAVRSGRVNIENAFGSELSDLAVSATVEYFNDGGYITNIDDSSCSSITLALVDPDLTDTLTVGDGSSSGETCIWDDDAESGADNCLADPAKPQFEEPPVSGDFNVWLKAPGAGYTGYMDVTGTVVPAWLQYDWNGTGLTTPAGRATFGLYRGDDRIIYWREQD